MSPIPTLGDGPLCDGQRRCVPKSASMGFFPCPDEEASRSTDQTLTDPVVEMPTTSKLEEDDGEIMSVERLLYPHCFDFHRRAVTRRPLYGRQEPFYTDAVVVGNGPSALALSAFLSGYRPYYEGSIKHPDAELHRKLEIDKSKSLLEQNLDDLCEGLEGRTSHQISLLYDYLVRPEADLGQENPSTLAWRRNECDGINEGDGCSATSSSTSTYVPHVVLGKGAVGGTWADLSPEVMTLSFASWLELPAYSFRDWLERDGANFATDLQMKIDATNLMVGRIPCAAIRRYYRDYVRALGLRESVFEYALVTSVRKRMKTSGEVDDGYNWDVYGCYSGGSFHFRCRWVVLATGVAMPRHIGIQGEDDPRIFHSPNQLDRFIAESNVHQECQSVSSGKSHHVCQPISSGKSCHSCQPISSGKSCHSCQSISSGKSYQPVPSGKSISDPVLIIGDGLSAADAIIKCLINGVPVIHSFRKQPKDSQQILSKLSKALYPEYHTVFQLMIGAAHDPQYVAYPRTEVQRFQFNEDDDNQGRSEFKDQGAMAASGSQRDMVTADNQSGLAVLRDVRHGSVQMVQFSRVVVLIGFEADLSFLRTNEGDGQLRGLCRDDFKLVNSKTNTILVNPNTCRSSQEEDLYALGPLIGDNYVRYVIGGSLAAAADILKRKAACPDRDW